MNSSHHYRCFSMMAFVWIITVFHALGQLAPDKQAAYQIRVSALDIVGESNILWLRTGPGKEPVKIELNTRIFSPPVKYRGGSVAFFYETKNKARAKKPGKAMARVKLPDQKALILFQPDMEGTGYSGYSATEKIFPFGSFRVVNFSKDKVRVDMDAKKTIIAAGKAATFPFKKGQRAVPVSIIARSAITGKPRYTRRSNWSIAPTQRELVLLLPNPRNGLIQARHFVDSRVEKDE